MPPKTTPELTAAEVEELRAWIDERRAMKAQARLLMMMAMGLAGVLGWIGFDHFLAALKAGWTKLAP